MSNPTMPAPAFKPPVTRMGLAGDRRTLLPGQTAQLIHIEFPLPRPMLIIVSLRDADTGGQANANVRVVTGIDRGISDDELRTVTGLNQAVLARSVQVTIESPANSVTPRLDVRAVLVPLDVTVPTTLFGSSSADPGRPNDINVDSIYGTPDAAYNGVAQSAVTVTISSPTNNSKGVTVYNASTANLFLKLWSGSGVNITNDYTIRMVPNSYYETPFGFTGAINGVWDAAGAGTANVTFLRS
jgi:hypothetical protein